MGRPKTSKLVHIENARNALLILSKRDPNRKDPSDALKVLKPLILDLVSKGMTEATIIEELKALVTGEDNIGIPGIRAMFLEMRKIELEQKLLKQSVKAHDKNEKRLIIDKMIIDERETDKNKAPENKLVVSHSQDAKLDANFNYNSQIRDSNLERVPTQYTSNDVAPKMDIYSNQMGNYDHDKK